MSDTVPSSRLYSVRLAASVLLLGVCAFMTWQTLQGLAERRVLRTDLAEIGHARYQLLNATVWIQKITPVLEANVDTLDLKNANGVSLRPMVQNALYRLLDDVKAKMSAKPAEGAAPSFFGGGNPMIANMVIGALRPHVPEYADVVLAELGKPDTRKALKDYLKGALEDGAKKTFGDVDLTAYNAILKHYGCADAAACHDELGRRIARLDERNGIHSVTALLAGTIAFVLLLPGQPRKSAIVVMLLFTMVLLAGGVLTPMLEVEAKISHIKMTFLGTPISFTDQVLYYQSKSVLEVFRALIDTNRPEMWAVGVLVLMFSIVFPILKLLASTLAMFKPGVVRASRVVKFFALESSKWSRADVMALAIFMAFVAFNGLIPNTMAGLMATGADIAIPTDSSKILPGYHIFIGFCVASLFVSKKVGRLVAAAAS
jgi:hypothetical protein